MAHWFRFMESLLGRTYDEAQADGQAAMEEAERSSSALFSWTHSGPP